MSRSRSATRLAGTAGRRGSPRPGDGAESARSRAIGGHRVRGAPEPGQRIRTLDSRPGTRRSIVRASRSAPSSRRARRSDRRAGADFRGQNSEVAADAPVPAPSGTPLRGGEVAAPERDAGPQLVGAGRAVRHRARGGGVGLVQPTLAQARLAERNPDVARGAGVAAAAAKTSAASLARPASITTSPSFRRASRNQGSVSRPRGRPRPRPAGPRHDARRRLEGAKHGQTVTPMEPGTLGAAGPPRPADVPERPQPLGDVATTDSGSGTCSAWRRPSRRAERRRPPAGRKRDRASRRDRP